MIRIHVHSVIGGAGDGSDFVQTFELRAPGAEALLETLREVSEADGGKLAAQPWNSESVINAIAARTDAERGMPTLTRFRAFQDTHEDRHKPVEGEEWLASNGAPDLRVTIRSTMDDQPEPFSMFIARIGHELGTLAG